MSPGQNDSDRLGALASFMRALTPRGVALLLVLVAIGGITYAAWEQRSTLLPLYLGSTVALTATGVAVSLVLLALILMDMYSRLESRAERAILQQVTILQQQITLLNEHNRIQQARIHEIHSDHVECQRQLQDMSLRLLHAGVK